MPGRELSPFHDIGFHGDRYLIELVRHCLGLSQQFIETGTNVGSTLAYVAGQFPHLTIYSCEPDREACEAAERHVAGCGNVGLFNLASPEIFHLLARQDPDFLARETVFWLDAHGYGFQWPLKDEIAFITAHFPRGYVFIDDFQVPGSAAFRWDEYQGQTCSFDYIKDAIAPGKPFRLYYPSYTDRTSRHHPLVGWGLIDFGHEQPLCIPEALRGKVREASLNTRTDAASYYSQHGEDVALSLLFQDAPRGVFVEVGCIDGRRFSNTLTFEERGWTGLCVEAHAGYINLLKHNRPHSIIAHCAAGEQDEDNVIFYSNPRGSLSTLDPTKEEHFRTHYGAFFHGFEPQRVNKRRLDSLFRQHGIREIDILSLDIEGSEAEALRGIDFTRYRPTVLVIESDGPDHEKAIEAVLAPHGYTKIYRIAENVFYLAGGVRRSHAPAGKTPTRAVVTHTQHPLDADGDQKVTVTIPSIPCVLLPGGRGAPATATDDAEGPSDGSVEITDRSVIDAFTAQPDNPFLISFPRTGSHWLRMIMELYFGRPSLVRLFYCKEATAFTCLHRHDLDLTIRRPNVIYLYREPVDTIYSQLRYHQQSLTDEERVRYWATLYGRHLAKWLVADTFTTKKTVLTYRGLQQAMHGEFKKLCAHLNAPFDEEKLLTASARVSKSEVKGKTRHDQQVIQLDAAYQENKHQFKDRYASLIWETVLAQHHDLVRWFTPEETLSAPSSGGRRPP
jgi:FkbM family methyltransferase